MAIANSETMAADREVAAFNAIPLDSEEPPVLEVPPMVVFG